MLQASLGGNHALFNVARLGERVFCFSVASKKVGFFIYNMRSYECQKFKVFFPSLGEWWPSVNREFAQWNQEEDSEWTLVQRKKKPPKKSCAEVAKLGYNKVLTGANVVPITTQSSSTPMKTVFDRLQFPRQSVFAPLDYAQQDHSNQLHQRHSKRHRNYDSRFRNQRSWKATTKNKAPSQEPGRKTIQNSNSIPRLKWVPKQKTQTLMSAQHNKEGASQLNTVSGGPTVPVSSPSIPETNTRLELGLSLAIEPSSSQSILARHLELPIINLVYKKLLLHQKLLLLK